MSDLFDFDEPDSSDRADKSDNDSSAFIRYLNQLAAERELLEKDSEIACETDELRGSHVRKSASCPESYQWSVKSCPGGISNRQSSDDVEQQLKLQLPEDNSHPNADIDLSTLKLGDMNLLDEESPNDSPEPEIMGPVSPGIADNAKICQGDLTDVRGMDSTSVHTTVGSLTEGEPSIARGKGPANRTALGTSDVTVDGHGRLDAPERAYHQPSGSELPAIFHEIDGKEYLSFLPSWKSSVYLSHSYCKAAEPKLETYYGCVLGKTDAILLVEACRTKLLLPVSPGWYYSAQSATRPGSVHVYRVDDFSKTEMLKQKDEIIIARTKYVVPGDNPTIHPFFSDFSIHRKTLWDVQDPQGTRWIVEWHNPHAQRPLLKRPIHDPLFCPLYHMLGPKKNKPRPLWSPEVTGRSRKKSGYVIFPTALVYNATIATNSMDSMNSMTLRNLMNSVDSGYASSMNKANEKITAPFEKAPHDSWQEVLGIREPDDVIASAGLHESSEMESFLSNVSGMEDYRLVYLREIANELAKVIEPYQPDDIIMQKVLRALPELLEAFALSLGHGKSTERHREAMAFIHKYRRDIVTTIEELLLHKKTEAKGQPASEMSLTEIIDYWQERQETPLDDQQQPPRPRPESPSRNLAGLIAPRQRGEEDEDEEEDISGQENPQLDTYRSIIRRAPTYQWLLSNIRTKCTLYVPGQGHKNEIKEDLFDLLLILSSVNQQKATESLNASFRVEWDPVRFLQEQEYQEAAEEAIERALTFTGMVNEIEAESCGEYLRRTWHSTGDAMVQLLKALVSSEHRGSVTLADGTRVNISRRRSQSNEGFMETCIDARGTAASIAEVSEQLGWLACALQSARDEEHCTCTEAFVEYVKTSYVFDRDTERKYLFDISIVKQVLSYDTGSCWLGLISTPAIAGGFPIKRRPLDCPPGLEIRLSTMACLLDTRKMHMFDGRVVIKGFSNLLVPTKSTRDVISWHFVQEGEGKRVSYLASQAFPKLNISLSQLEKARHILGWCPEVCFYPGADDANYKIEDSRLPRQSELQVLKDAFLSSDYYITEATPCSLGRKDVRLRRNGYVSKMKWIAEKYVNLWDVGEEKGWLVNGSSAVLHLVRASLARDMSDSTLESVFLLKTNDIREALTTHHPDSALEVLLNLSNLALTLYRVDADVTFKTRVEDYYDQFEKMYDYQVGGLRRNGKPPRSLLEGWDFQDLVQERDPIHPRHSVLNDDGFSWVDFTRSINAITLFGRGFGELMRPLSSSGEPPVLEPKRSYLAATMFDLVKIMEAKGDPYSVPMKLTNDTLWHPVEATFDHCSCDEQGHGHRAIAVQSLLPSCMSSEIAQMSSTLTNHGAVVFGFDKMNKWFWGEAGLPSRAPPRVGGRTPHTKPASVYSDDSGIGRSLSPSTELETGGPSSASVLGGKGSSARLQVPLQADSRPGNHLYRAPAAKDYMVGIVCALHIELMAVRALFDKSYPSVEVAREDPNYYAHGRMEGHKVVAACLPHGIYGTNAATEVLSNMRRSFPFLKFCLLVGIGAGVPSPRNDIRLGDVVVSTPSGRYPGVLPYDMIKSLDGGISQLNGYLCPPPQTLMCAISELESDPSRSSEPLEQYVQKVQDCKPQYIYPGAEQDRLFTPGYMHPNDHGSCEECHTGYLVKRQRRVSTQPRIFYGLIASGNRLMRSAYERDKLGKEHNVLCFEMEGAGMMNNFPCLIIRGICDYADSHKNKVWQHYASATAAAYAKLLLSRVRTTDTPGRSLVYDDALEQDLSRKRSRSPDARSDWKPRRRRNPTREPSDVLGFSEADLMD